MAVAAAVEAVEVAVEAVEVEAEAAVTDRPRVPIPSTTKRRHRATISPPHPNKAVAATIYPFSEC